MKLKKCMLLIAAIMIMAAPAWADSLKKVTGADWLIMSGDERKTHITSIVKFLNNRGVFLQKTEGYYGYVLNNMVDKPGTEKVDVMNLLTAYIYRAEPQTRAALDRFRRKPGTTPEPKVKSQAPPVKKKQSLY